MVDLSGVLGRLPDRDAVVTALERVPVTRDAISPFVPGESVSAAVAAAQSVLQAGMSVAVVHLPDPADGDATRGIHEQIIEAFTEANLAVGTDLVIDLADLGLSQGVDSAAVAEEVAALCGAAELVGMTVTVDALSHEHLDTGLSIHAALIADHPDLGVTLAAHLLRSEADCGDVARAGARVRLVRQAGQTPKGLSFAGDHEIDKAYIRCMRQLMAGAARPLLATQDQRLIEIAGALAVRSDRDPSTYAFQFPLGVRQDSAAELVSAGSHVGVLVPFGPGWSNYLLRQIALKPDVVGQAARAAMGR